MALNGRQIKQLRALAHHLNPVVMIGKNDINMPIVDSAIDAMDKHELIKCSVLDGSTLTTAEAAHELAQRCGAEVVQVVGRKFSIYRRSHRKDIKHIDLVN